MIEMIKQWLFGDRIETALLIPYERGDIYSYLCSRYGAKNTDYRVDGIYLEADLPLKDYQQLENYRV